MRQLKVERLITGLSTASLNQYLKEIGRIPLLTIGEEVILTRMIKAGDVEALEKMIVSNLRFVVTVAKNYQHRGLCLEDLISEGNLGMMKAAIRFDETKGFKFISFAVWWIRQSIMVALPAQSRSIRLPLNMITCITKIKSTISILEQKYERHPTLEEIAENIGITEDMVGYCLEKAHYQYSLDAIWDVDMENTLLDLLQNSEADTDHLVAAIPEIENLKILLKALTKREKKILILHFGLTGKDPLTLEDISKSFNLSRERIRQLKDSGLNKLRLNSLRRIRIPKN